MKDDVMYDDILAYDLTTNECRIISKLPYPLCFMSTVQQENKVDMIFIYLALCCVLGFMKVMFDVSIDINSEERHKHQSLSFKRIKYL